MTGLRPDLVGVLTRSRGEFADILERSDLIVEVMGGLEPAREHVLAAMAAGRHVVTANKQLLSQHGEELWSCARQNRVQLRFEAAVAGVVPVIRVLQETLAAAHVDRLHGIVNGTTNFILTRMADTGASYDYALAEAQRLKHAEADPTEDVNGKDAAAKMAILARLAFNTPVHLDDVRYEGIVAGGGAPLRRRIQALLASNTPGGLLDLSLLDGRDGWAEPVADALRRHAQEWDDAQQLVALLAAATGTRPTNEWRRRSRVLASSYGGYGELLRGLLEPLLWIEPVSSGRPTATDLARRAGERDARRGAAWAAADVDEAWVVPLLGRLALRSAAPSPHPKVTTALCHPAASGAIEALAAIGGPDAHAELRRLLAEVRRRRDLVKRIAAVVGEPPEATLARDDRLRREKRRLLQLIADPEPKARQRAASAYVRSDLAPMLRAAGFDDSAGRTFWRRRDDRVEVLHCRARTSGLSLELGIWFGFVPRADLVPEHEGRLRPAKAHCDMRGRVQVSSDGLEAAGRASALWFARWRPLDAVLRALREGTQSEDAFGWGAPDSPQLRLLTGYVAREAGNVELARGQLALAAAYYRGELDEPDAERERTPEWKAWVEALEADAARV